MEKQGELKRPIRVVLFGGGPVLEKGVKRFICRLEKNPEIEFLGGFCQSRSQSFWAVTADLWHRRRFLAIPLLLMQISGSAGRFLFRSGAERELNRIIAGLADRIHFVSDIHAEHVLEEVRALAPDLGVLYSSPILKPMLFQIPRFGTLGIHHGKVPKYRGKKTTFWEIYNGESTAGVTIQRVNRGLDTGEIVLQGEVPIGRRALRTVWNQLENLGLDLYVLSILAIKRGQASYKPQVGRQDVPYSDPELNHILIFWLRQLKRCLGLSRSGS
jgi:folate-dependent phosphoribosylglycinamide formyltransferase PurN